jgi:hypothetical protein
MKTSNTYQRKTFNATLIIFLYLILGIYSCFAQSFQRITHTGIETSFGIHGIKSPMNGGSSKLQALTRGFSAGFVTGNNLIQLRIRPIGVYKSAAMESRAFEILESEALLNVYPLEFFRTRKHVLDIYVSTGISFNSYKYKNRNVFLQNNGLAAADMEFDALNKVAVINQVGGIGIEYHLPFSFVHVFTEAVFSNPMYLSTSNQTFRETLKQASTCFNFGIRIGTKKNIRNNKVYPG